MHIPFYANFPLRERALAFLDDTARFYNEENRGCDKDGGGIYYLTENSPGCAIGRYCDQIATFKMKKKINTSYLQYLPNWMKEIDIKILSAIQNLHDYPSHWCANGISLEGAVYYHGVKSIINEIYSG